MKDFLNKLRKNKIHISLEDESLKIKFDDEIPNDILLELKTRKEELITFLKNNDQAKDIILIPKVAKQENYQVSSLQQSIWSISQLSKGTSAYNISEIFNFKGKINKEKFELSLIQTIKRHEILRTVFKKNEFGDIRQFILDENEAKFRFNFQDFSGQKNAEEDAKNIVKAEIDYAFDLSADSLFRCSLVKVNSDEYIFCVIIHHIICDGWSINLLISEVLSNYTNSNQNEKESSETLRIQYKDYSEWQQNNLKNGFFEKHKSYWTDKFLAVSPQLELPSFKKRPKIKSYNGKKLKHKFSEDISNKLFNISKNNSTTLFSSLVGIVNLLIYKYTDSTDITIGTVVAGRTSQELEKQIGMYVNTIPIRTKFQKENSFSELLKNVTNNLFEAIEHQQYPFNELINDLKLKRDISRSPLFDVLVILQNQNKIFSSDLVLGDFQVSKNTDFLKESSQYDITFEFFESENSIDLQLEFNTDIYDEFIINNIIGHIDVIINDVFKNNSKTIVEIDYLAEKEKNNILSRSSQLDTNNSSELLKIQILSENLELKSDGAIGKIHISKTNELKKSIVEEVINPFNSNEILFNTGLSGKWISEERLQYLNTKNEVIVSTKDDFVNHLKQNETDFKKIKIVSSFTAEPLNESLNWMLEKLELDYKITFGGYHQVFQELFQLDNDTEFGCDDALVVLNRFEDYITFDEENKIKETLDLVYHKTIEILLNANFQSPILYFLFPINKEGIPENVLLHINELHGKLELDLRNINNVYLINLQNFDDQLCYDDYSFKHAKIPFTEKFFFEISYNISRKLYGLKSKSFKVIALDCDNTLWEGICGESSIDEIKIGEGHKYLQKLVVQKHKEGFVIVLLSKNNEADVWEVFEKHPEMILKKEHILKWGINWNKKQNNIEELSEELKLGLDSFIFIDDNPLECHEMMEYHPEVLTLELPQNSQNFKSFLDKVFAFDKLNLTKEDLMRNEMYKSDYERDKFKATLDPEAFLKTLNLELSFKTAEKNELERVSQLTFRTNQFNLNGIQRTAQEIENLLSQGHKCYTISVRDRFGDYGLVGAIIVETKDKNSIIQSFMLSCRALGRNIEDVAMSQLKQVLAENNYENIYANFIETAKNKPFVEFVYKNKWESTCVDSDSFLKIDFTECKLNNNFIKIYLEQNLALEVSNQKIITNNQIPRAVKQKDLYVSNETWVWKKNLINESNLYHKKAYKPLEFFYYEVFKNQLKLNKSINNNSNYIEPRDIGEEKLCDIFKEVLNVDRLSITDDFFELGGNSLNVNQIISRIFKEFSIEISFEIFFNNSNVKLIYDFITEQNITVEWFQKGNLIEDNEEFEEVLI